MPLAPGMAESANASNVFDALLAMLDPGSTGRYFDIFLESHIDLSRISWILLANTLAGVPAPLLDRVTVLEARRPTVEEVERGFDAMAASWLNGRAVPEGAKQRALAKFRETRSLRDLRSAVERGRLQALWQPPGPRPVDPID